MTDKPHKGRLVYWYREIDEATQLYRMVGYHLDRNEKPGWIITSVVHQQTGDQIETHNSHYTLVGDEKSYAEALMIAAKMIVMDKQEFNGTSKLVLN